MREDRVNLFSKIMTIPVSYTHLSVCSNVETGKAEYIKCTDLFKQIDVIRASASMPFVSQIVETEGFKLLDGGVCDSVPVKKFMEMGYDRLIVVLTKPKGHVPKPNSPIMSRKKYGEYPNFVDALITRHLRYAENLRYVNEMEDNGPVSYTHLDVYKRQIPYFRHRSILILNTKN